MLPFWPDQALLLYVCHEYEKSAREDQANREATSNVYWSIWDGSKQNWVVDGSDAKSTAGLTDIMPEKKDNNKKMHPPDDVFDVSINISWLRCHFIIM